MTRAPGHSTRRYVSCPSRAPAFGRRLYSPGSDPEASAGGQTPYFDNISTIHMPEFWLDVGVRNAVLGTLL